MREHKIYEKKSPNILDYFHSNKIDLVINIVDKAHAQDVSDSYEIRRAATDSNITLFTKIKNAQLFVEALVNKGYDKLEIKAWSEYV